MYPLLSSRTRSFPLEDPLQSPTLMASESMSSFRGSMTREEWPSASNYPKIRPLLRYLPCLTSVAPITFPSLLASVGQLLTNNTRSFLVSSDRLFPEPQNLSNLPPLSWKTTTYGWSGPSQTSSSRPLQTSSSAKTTVLVCSSSSLISKLLCKCHSVNSLTSTKALPIYKFLKPSVTLKAQRPGHRITQPLTTLSSMLLLITLHRSATSILSNQSLFVPT